MIVRARGPTLLVACGLASGCGDDLSGPDARCAAATARVEQAASQLNPVRARRAAIDAAGCAIAFASCQPDVFLQDEAGRWRLIESGACDVFETTTRTTTARRSWSDGGIDVPVAVLSDGSILVEHTDRAVVQGDRDYVVHRVFPDGTSDDVASFTSPFYFTFMGGYDISSDETRFLHTYLGEGKPRLVEHSLLDRSATHLETLFRSPGAFAGSYDRGDTSVIMMRWQGDDGLFDPALARWRRGESSPEVEVSFRPPHQHVLGARPAVSPVDGAVVYYVAQRPTAHPPEYDETIWRLDAGAATPVQLTAPGDLNRVIGLRYAPDGSRVAIAAATPALVPQVFVVDPIAGGSVNLTEAISTSQAGSIGDVYGWDADSRRVLVDHSVVPEDPNDTQQDLAWLDVVTRELVPITGGASPP